MEGGKPNSTGSGMPRWLVYVLATKLVLVLSITLAIVIYANS